MWRDVFLHNKRGGPGDAGALLARTSRSLQRAIRWGEGDKLFDLFTRTRAIRRSIIEAGQDIDAPDFGRQAMEHPKAKNRRRDLSPLCRHVADLEESEPGLAGIDPERQGRIVAHESQGRRDISDLAALFRKGFRQHGRQCLRVAHGQLQVGIDQPVVADREGAADREATLGADILPTHRG